MAGILQHAHAPFAAGKAYGERTDVAPYGAVLCVAAQQDAAERVAERRREQQQTQRNSKVIPCAEQQPPFRDRAERCGESGERGGGQKIQAAEPNKRPFAAERRKAERRACEHAHGQSGEERE